MVYSLKGIVDAEYAWLQKKETMTAARRNVERGAGLEDNVTSRRFIIRGGGAGGSWRCGRPPCDSP